MKTVNRMITNFRFFQTDINSCLIVRRRTFGLFVNKTNWRESEAYRNFGKRFDWSLAIKRHFVMAAPKVETIWLVNGFKRPAQLPRPLTSKIKWVRQDDSMVSRGVLMIETKLCREVAIVLPYVLKFYVHRSRSKFPSRVFTSGMTHFFNACYTLHFY